jgi:hypothetical protein
MGGTGNIRTLRSQSGTVGHRTFLSIIASGSSSGSGSVRRMYAYYKKQNPEISPFTQMFNINNGHFRNQYYSR